ncbi:MULTISPECIES: succinate dehydrogenase, hydrophobic membrane anchor protein [unclassified Novosphingobium]|jgi:succinate dehydrogenase / fumarate reductase membrane anchor subunit|uniref:succinate dehydrogenase, hydrophobic membrane anchor protein n=1 Tax=unclassified Novosphingobium TaxID=2644732 RepID=UPI00061C479B|nr:MULTISPECIES: succinate dehydrogenase, hydrophobic membrane anchor protein [unclassified Novosphingobium]MBF5091841.1 succinate dehydrogenase, hydrophobic membrane anchor protein [Novosphingobium sp. NBM11]RQW43375.1 succinate dehydrogenase, hydrophobic membrane anchor protein [Novosphingobium sp. LASN5T]GAO55662.1 succinate dehydrogenase hydrophobic membrane anchor protein [Novosphingobium sp. MD-1]
MGNGTSIGRVRGLGSSHQGAHHWLLSRLTAVGNIVLIPFLLASLALLPAYDYATVHAWAARPLSSTALILIMINTFYHARLGVQVMLEDYLHEDAGKFTAWLLVNLVPFAGAAFGILSVLRIALGGA